VWLFESQRKKEAPSKSGTKKSQPVKVGFLGFGGGWLTTEQLSICAQEGMVGNER
jgi:hypothetical protein